MKHFIVCHKHCCDWHDTDFDKWLNQKIKEIDAIKFDVSYGKNSAYIMRSEIKKILRE